MPDKNGARKTVLDEFYRVAFRKKIYGSIGELHSDLDDWVKNYNEERPHQVTGPHRLVRGEC